MDRIAELEALKSTLLLRIEWAEASRQQILLNKTPREDRITALEAEVVQLEAQTAEAEAALEAVVNQ